MELHGRRQRTPHGELPYRPPRIMTHSKLLSFLTTKLCRVLWCSNRNRNSNRKPKCHTEAENPLLVSDFLRVKLKFLSSLCQPFMLRTQAGFALPPFSWAQLVTSQNVILTSPSLWHFPGSHWVLSVLMALRTCIFWIALAKQIFVFGYVFVYWFASPNGRLWPWLCSYPLLLRLQGILFSLPAHSCMIMLPLPFVHMSVLHTQLLRFSLDITSLSSSPSSARLW